jgi:hypothetical protein
MNYISNKVQGQELMFHIEMERNGQNLAFNVVCAQSDLEIPELISQYLEMLDSPPAVQAHQQRIAELKQKLAESDFKFNVDYDDQDTPEWNQLKADRQAWRDEVRELEAL